jgi:hypothetical protein
MRVRSRTALLVALVVCAASAALTAVNGVPASRAGAGAGAITGYTVTNVRYTLQTARPERLQRVRFRLTAPGARVVRVRLVTGGAWFPCALGGGGRNASCNLRGLVRVRDADRLEVVAVR